MRKNIFLSAILVFLCMVGCVRNISTVKFYPKENVTEEVTTEKTTENGIEIKYINNEGDKNKLELWSDLVEADIPTGDYVEGIINFPENIYMNSYVVSGYDIFYSTHGDEVKIMCYNCLSGETTEIINYDTGFNLSVMGACDYYLVWSRYSRNEPIYGYDGKEKYVMCEIMDLRTGEVVEFASLGAGNDFLGFTAHPYVIGMDYDTITWEGTISRYDFWNEKSEVVLEDLHNFLACSSNNGDIIVETFAREDYIYEVYDCYGKFLRGFEMSTYVDNVQYTGYVFSASVRDDYGQFIYAFDCKKEIMLKIKYNGTMDYVCFEDRIYTRGLNNSGIRVIDVGDMIYDDKYIDDNISGFGVYSFGIYTYQQEIVNDCQRYIFKLYR